MAFTSVTYTFSNGSTSDASQVNQNFTDIINGMSDGTKDMSIAALTVSGNASFSGNVILGNASGDDVTVTGSLASSIPIKTTNSYDIGSSTLGLRALYFGANSQTVNIKGSGSMSATWTLTLPVSAGTSGYVLQTDGSGVTSWLNRYADRGYAFFASATQYSTTSASFVTPNDASYASPTVAGLCSAPSTSNDLGFKVSSLPAGTYVVTFSGNIQVAGSTNTVQGTATITDQSGFSPLIRLVAGAAENNTISMLQGIFTYGTTQTDINFTLELRRDAGDGTIYVQDGSQGWYFTIQRLV